jgi:hypothetical protein
MTRQLTLHDEPGWRWPERRPQAAETPLDKPAPMAQVVQDVPRSVPVQVGIGEASSNGCTRSADE